MDYDDDGVGGGGGIGGEGASPIGVGGGGGGIGVLMGASAGMTRTSSRRRECRICGQIHPQHEPHVYDYVEEIDEDITCHICLQPLVTPVDTPCGHTFCRPCLLSFLKIQQLCPVDRQPLTQKLCSFSSLVLKKILEKLQIKCPNVTQCDLTMARGDLEDHLKYRCPGNWVCCQYSTAGCDYRGPQRSLTTHAGQCAYKESGIKRPPILEGEVTHIEVPRTQTALGITIVGGSDTPLRCVVIQEVFPDGLLSQDGRIQSGDQIIEVDGLDMMTATHLDICQALKQSISVLRLGVYRERIEAYKSTVASPTNSATVTPTTSTSSINASYSAYASPSPRETLNVTLTRETGRQLGIKLGGRRTEPGIFIMEVLDGSVASMDGRLIPQDRILAINGGDVRYAQLDLASKLIQQSRGHVSLIVSRGHNTTGEYDHLFKKPHPSLAVAHSRTKSAPDRLVARLDLPSASDKMMGDTVDGLNPFVQQEDNERSASCESLTDRSTSLITSPNPRINSNSSLESPRGKRYNNGSLGSLSGVEETQYQSNGSLGSAGSQINQSLGSLISPQPSQSMIESTDYLDQPPALPPRSRQPLPRTQSHDHLQEFHLLDDRLPESSVDPDPIQESSGPITGSGLSAAGCVDVPDGLLNRPKGRRSRESSDLTDLCHGIRKSLKIEGSTLNQKTVTISKGPNESLGMRIGGGVSSNEGDTPIYIANINPQGPVGKSKQVKKGDVLLSVNGQSLLGLTHSQAVTLLKATAELAGVTLSLLEGPETSLGPANFVPSWLYWQKLPRSLHISKSVVLHRTQRMSLGFSIVGGSDPQRGPEPIHVLFVVPTSPAAIDGKLRCGDRILAVDGHSLEAVPHSAAVSLLKQAGQRVHLEVISWLGTEI